jgi:acyl carrier protein
MMDVIMELEDRFDVTLPMNVAADIVTIDQLAEAVVSQRARR